MDVENVIKGITSLARTKTYKRRTDNTIKSKEESGMQAAMDKLFDTLGKEHPDLYSKVYDIAKRQLDESASAERKLGDGE